MKHYISMLVIAWVNVCAVTAQSNAPDHAPRQAHVIPGQTPTSPPLEVYFDRWDNGTAQPDEHGFIRNWVLLEPLDKPNATNTVFTDSYLRDVFSVKYFAKQLTQNPKDLPKNGQREKVGDEKLRWHALQSKMYNMKLFRFASGLKTRVYGVMFWFYTIIDCQEALTDVRLSVGSNAASMWWIDGKETLLLSGDRRMVMDDAASSLLTLDKGRHLIWGAVINGPGMSDFCVRFIDQQHNPTRGFSVVNH